jgi:hypothetical protein
MSGMNPWLAEIYGTDGADDLEKTAQTHLLAKLAEENNLDLNQFTPEQLQELLQEVMGEQVMQQGQQAQPGIPQQGLAPQIPQAAPQQGQPQGQHPAMTQAFAPAAQPQVPQGMAPGAMQPQGGADMASLQKEAQAKFEEADLLGRVMAHAYTQELEKIAASKTAGKLDGLKGVAGKARGAAETGALKGMYAADKAKNHIKANKGAYAAGAAGAAGGFAAGRASKSKEASAFEKLAEMHAADILSAAGFDPSTGMDTTQQQVDPAAEQQQVQTEQQQAGGVAQPGQQVEQPQPGADFAQALDQRSLEMLGDAGYDVNEVLARLQLAQGQQGQA